MIICRSKTRVRHATPKHAFEKIGRVRVRSVWRCRRHGDQAGDEAQNTVVVAVAAVVVVVVVVVVAAVVVVVVVAAVVVVVVVVAAAVVVVAVVAADLSNLRVP